MSSAASTSDFQTPRQEVLGNLADQSPALGMPRLIAVDHLHKSMAAARRRVEDSHAMQTAKLKELTGLDYEAQPVPSDEEEMIAVQGDTVTHNHYGPKEPSPVAAVASTGMSTLAKVGVGAALAAAGVGLPVVGAAAWELLDNDPPAVVAPVNPGAPPVDTDTDTYLPYDFGIE